MQRYLHVRGKPGVPVSSPHHPNDSWRFVGQRRTVEKIDPNVHDSLIDLFEPVDEVIPDHTDLAKPIRNGELIVHGKVGFRNLEAARNHFMPAKVQPSKSTKPAEQPVPKQPTNTKTPPTGRDE